MGDCPIKVVGATSARCGFVMSFEAFPCATVPNTGFTGHSTRQETPILGSTAISGAAAEPFLAGIFRRRATDHSKGRQCTMADCDSPARFFLRRKRQIAF